MKRSTLILAVTTVLVFFSLPIPARSESAKPSVLFPSGTRLHPEVVDTPEKRSRGLMFRGHLPEGGGMLFVFEIARPYAFWMKNCRFAIDIIWINKAKKIVYISENTPPCKKMPCPIYGPKKKAALYVLEVAAGFTKEEGLKAGDKIVFSF